MTANPQTSLSGLRQHVHLALDSGIGSGKWSVLTHRVIVSLIIISILAMIAESVPTVAAQWSRVLLAVEIIVITGFTIEYALRFWSAPEATPYAEMHPWRARWKYITSPMAVLDLLSIAPLYLSLFAGIDLRALLMLRLLRFFKLARYSPGMRSLVNALVTERKALLATAVVLVGVVLIAASAMHLVEADAQPKKFGTIPDAMWWAIVTVTTVGYGDVVPVTMAGRMIAALTTICGLIMLALPVGIIATAFAEDIHKREFVVTWGMLARVPIFSGLSAIEIADLMRYLRSQTVQPGTTIMRQGEDGSCIYFITSGDVTIQTPDEELTLSKGEFFGEISVLQKRPRSATARATNQVKLLVLDSADLNALMERSPTVRERIETVAHERSATGWASPQSDE